MAEIVLDRVTKEFDNGFVAIDDVSLTVADGEFLVLVGPSGCGKSTLLRMIAGLEEVTAGTVYIGGRDVTELAPRHRDIAMVFQNYALYPHMDVRRNLAYGLKVRKTSRDEIDRRVEQVAHLLGLEKLLDRKPAALSGGQRQRVAMGRAIVREPAAFLMDEPLSNLDAKLRVEMRAYIARLHQELGTTTLYVTHDQTEAMTMGDRVAVMRDGRLEQVDSPQRLYEHPVNVFVAGFIGSPAMNLLRGNVSDGWVELGSQKLRLARRTMHSGEVVVGIRPEAVAPAASLGDDVLELRVVLSEMLGSDVLLHLQSEAPSVLTGDMLDLAAELDVSSHDRFIARVPPDVRPAPGEVVRLRVDMERVHLFDPETEQVILR